MQEPLVVPASIFHRLFCTVDKIFSRKVENQLIKKRSQNSISVTEGKTNLPPSWSCSSAFCEPGSPGLHGLSGGEGMESNSQRLGLAKWELEWQLSNRISTGTGVTPAWTLGPVLLLADQATSGQCPQLRALVSSFCK